GERAVRMTLTDIPKRHTCALMSHRRADVASAYMVIISIDANQHSTLKKIVVVWGWTRDNDGLKGGVTTPTNREAALSTTQLTRITSALAQALSVDEVNQIGRDTGQSERLRTVTPHRLLLAIIASLASAKVESIADLLREFNHQNGVTVAYKAFYNRLARPSFSKFMSRMFDRLVARLSLRTLTPEGQTAVARFKDIVIQDGSSFALKKQLRDAFPGRFTTTDPAAVELHATYRGFSDEVSRVQLA